MPASTTSVSPFGLKPTSHTPRIPPPSLNDARSSSSRNGRAGFAHPLTELTTRQFSHVLIPARPKYTPNFAVSSPLPPGPSLSSVQYGGPRLQISSRVTTGSEVRFRLSKEVDGVITIWPEDVLLERLFDIITPEQLQTFEHEQYMIEEEQQQLRLAAKGRGRPPGSKKRPSATGLSRQARSGKSRTWPPSSITSETGPLQRDSDRSLATAPSQPIGQSTNSSGASTRSTRSQQSEEPGGRYRMLPRTPRRTLQHVIISPTPSPASLKTVCPAHKSQQAGSVPKINSLPQPATVPHPLSRSVGCTNDEMNNGHVFRPTATLKTVSISSFAQSSAVDLEDSDDEQSENSEALLRQFQGQIVQSIIQRAPSRTPNLTHTIDPTSSPSPVPAPSSFKPRASPTIPTLTPRTTKKRKRLFTRKSTTPKRPAQEDDWFVECIVGHRKPSYPSRFLHEYLIKWQDHPHEENTWESEDTLVEADEILEGYWAKVAVVRAGEHEKSWVRAAESVSDGEDDDGDMEMLV